MCGGDLTVHILGRVIRKVLVGQVNFAKFSAAVNWV